MKKEFWDTYFNKKQEVSAITISDTLPDIPTNAYLVTDISEAQDGSVMAWMCTDYARLQFHILAGEETAADDIMEMFGACERLGTTDFRGLDRSKVKDVSYMSFGREAPTITITIFDTLSDFPYPVTFTSEAQGNGVRAWVCNDDIRLHVHIAANGKVAADENIMKMFRECKHLEAADLRGLDTSKVTDMSGMFSGCESLKTLDVSGFDTSQVENMEAMFDHCQSLESLDVSGFDTSKVESVSRMFSDCHSLETLDVSGFDTSQVRDMLGMFYRCESLKTLNVSGFDTSKTKDMSYMFSGCRSLENLDVSGFDTSQAGDTEDMFSGCESLKNS